MPEIPFDAFGLPEAPLLSLDLDDLDQTVRLGRALAEVFGEGVFIGLLGNLGAGKTTLVQAMVAQLSPGFEARSPTYTLLNHYETQPPMVHIDLYRLESYDDLESIGYWDYVEEPSAISCVEWLDRIPNAWPGEGILIELTRTDEARRARLWASERYRAMLAEDVAARLGMGAG
ncbi:tRNA (adenosine(37)-N6)-threonylcarbamoyltransferase complex ATPase subunit type 1 TsaE [Bradymonas sediminis]|uniref:tRNA threonylcarbamoyladenosine biosynthesis protein TsaE n=1 Tax=Bradymonas sediminis TaxID=1548548 RepID=A0A2Z4FJK2_9DELT|nr:tRNA (adenosine(37)-N6)-threonylcarbamoyltransferase complex ATPase subunit type 1 TsaE [Bradymonas sediminis]AWV88995.1 tRNA (adenosine(37)-N6)-threonylcarbamoyltransferase complex ATPase subunit type 1 TsaE [Bradymonas sediminis]TDP72008.1 tRNA threonylcarbamoyladenosine biosynthesis protein TsaE [Bradymonas sediminis]